MKQFIGITLFFFSFFSPFLAQTTNDLDELQKHYEAFEYSTVIAKSKNLLLDKNRFSEQDLTQIFTLKAASHYAMGDKANTRKSFIELLKLEKNFELNSVKYSPKLIELFNNVKEEFADILQTKNKNPQLKNRETVNLESQKKVINSNLNTAIAKSIVLPGWGHLHIKNNTKGWILTSASTITLGSLIYFIFDTNSKEKNYLSEINFALIQDKYNKYNSSYKIRNTLIATYAAIWIYSQIDMLFFSNELGSKNITSQILNNFLPADKNSIAISFKINF